MSVSGLIAHRALAEATPTMLAAWRMGAASVLFVAVGAARKRRARAATMPLPSAEWLRLALAGVLLAFHFIAWFWSLRLTSVSVATLLVCTTPLWTAMGQRLLGRESIGREFWPACAAALVGIAMVVHPSGDALGFAGERRIRGDGLALLGGALFAAYLLTVDGLQRLPSTRIVCWTYSVAAGVLWLVAFATGHVTADYSSAVWGAIALLTLVPQIVGHTLINHVLNYFPAHVVAFSILAEPIVAASLAVAILGETVTGIMVVGGVVVLTAMGVVLSRSKRKPLADDLEEL